MYRNFFHIAVVFLALHTAQAQKQLVWPLLGMTTYTENMETGAYIPKFPSILEEKFEGEEVIVTGYIIPMDVAAKKYALSKNPFSSCFFCGNAGPETAIELRFKEEPDRFATDHYMAIKGLLILNRNGKGLFFTLKQAETAEL